jgi:hypothetical protein
MTRILFGLLILGASLIIAGCRAEAGIGADDATSVLAPR